jgi:hypothetical protein
MRWSVSSRIDRLFAVVFWVCFHSLGDAGTVTLVAVEDATISEQEPSTALGGDTSFKSGTTGPMAGAVKNRALVKFDFANHIPSDAVVTSAALTLTVVQTPPTTDQVWFELHKSLVPWSETSATWISRLSSSTEAAWSVPGAAAPTDYAGAITQSCLITGLAKFTFASNPTMVANVQEWVATPGQNAGWFLLCASEDLEKSVRKFGSHEAPDPASRPALTVEFSVPERRAPALTVLAPADGEFRFEFEGVAGVEYTVQTSTDLEATHWLDLKTFAPLPAASTLRVSDRLLDRQNRFYRVVRSP